MEKGTNFIAYFTVIFQSFSAISNNFGIVRNEMARKKFFYFFYFILFYFIFFEIYTAMIASLWRFSGSISLREFLNNWGFAPTTRSASEIILQRNLWSFPNFRLIFRSDPTHHPNWHYFLKGHFDFSKFTL